MIATGKKTIPASPAGANTPRRRGFVYEAKAAVPADRLSFAEDGHAADPGQLLDLITDADARNAQLRPGLPRRARRGRRPRRAGAGRRAGAR